MNKYNTGDPVPSASMPNVWDNMLSVDEFVGSDEDTLITRSGIVRKTMAGMEKDADENLEKVSADASRVVEETRQNLIPLSRQYMTLADAQADIANIPEGSTTYYRSPDDSALAIEVINNSGTLSATGRVMPSQGYVDVTISEAIDKNDDSNLSKSITSDGITTELETESGEKFFSGMNESLQEMASRSWKDNTSNL
ncbi:TPA: hypothetical protein ACYUR1_003469, partial [Klebsiella oxytoca]